MFVVAHENRHSVCIFHTLLYVFLTWSGIFFVFYIVNSVSVTPVFSVVFCS